MAFNHNSRAADSEPDWGNVDKGELPREAFAEVGDAAKPSTWKYPHHWVSGGRKLDANRHWADGTLYLHRGGLAAAWAAANGARSGSEASPEVKEHLRRHRTANGLATEITEDTEAEGLAPLAARPALTRQGKASVNSVISVASRAALNSFLKDAGFSTAGDLVHLEPSESETKEVRRSEKSVVVTISTRARDRHGDIVDPEGVRLERFRKNPVVLYAHSYDGLPVARSLWERVRVDNGKSELIAKPQFHLDTELSREVWALVEKGVLSAWSVGFLPEKWKIVKTPASDGPGGVSRADTARGADCDRSFLIERWDLLEYSCVPVPANFEALTRELKSRKITAPALVKSLEPLGFEAPDLVPAPVRPATGVAENTELGDLMPTTRGTRGTGPSVPPVLSVTKVVSDAFDRIIRRARGDLE